MTLSEKRSFAAAPAQVNELREELQKLQIDVDKAIEAGQRLLYEEREEFSANGNRFDPYHLNSVTSNIFIAQATAEGWSSAHLIDITVALQTLLSSRRLKNEGCDLPVFMFQNAPIIQIPYAL